VKRRVIAWAAAGLALSQVAGPSTVVAAPPSPDRVDIAAIGDSITTGTNSFGWYGPHPSLSWSTGFNPLDGLNSHYERLIRADPWPWPRELNAAEAGATMADAPEQARRVVEAGADYVTFLLGANDLCASSPEAMTPIGAFRSDLERALAILSEGLPDGRVFVASIPNLFHLWRLFHDHPVAGVLWRVGRICPSMLDPGNSPLDRLRVLAREYAYNYVLADVCSRHPNCVFDGYAVFRHPLDADEVSRMDFFHPSLQGQNTLASLTWELVHPG
jgi:hypothetical protein